MKSHRDLKAIFLICDQVWVVLDGHILSDSLVVKEHGFIGMSLHEIIQGTGQAELDLFKRRIASGAILSDEELRFQGEATSMRFFGCSIDDRYIVAGGSTPEEVLDLCIALTASAESDVRKLVHRFLATLWKRPAANGMDAHIFDDISRLNNEIVNTNRELAKRNLSSSWKERGSG